MRVRTTLDIDADVLLAAQEIVAARNVAVAIVVSELLPTGPTVTGDASSKRVIMNGLCMVPPTGNVVTSKMVRELREKDV